MSTVVKEYFLRKSIIYSFEKIKFPTILMFWLIHLSKQSFYQEYFKISKVTTRLQSTVAAVY